MTPILHTDRQKLRPFRGEDAAAVADLVGKWDVARMLARVPHPYTREMAEAWIAAHENDAARGGEFIFCIELDGAVVGSAGVRRSSPGVYELGYWLGEPYWGRGHATEAAQRVVRFAFEELEATRLVSGHFTDNPVSARVLEKCGFRYSGDCMEHCAARGEAVAHRNFELGWAEWTRRI